MDVLQYLLYIECVIYGLTYIYIRQLHTYATTQSGLSKTSVDYQNH